MKILLIINHSLRNKLINEINLFLEASKELNIDLDIKTNFEINYILENNKPFLNEFNYSGVIFYDKDLVLAKTIEDYGIKVFNSSEAINVCDNKAYTYQKLSKNNIPIPKTITIPLSFFYSESDYYNFLNLINQNIGYPLVAKKYYGSWGQQVYLVKNEIEAKELINKNEGKELLFQHFYSECRGKDIRLNCVGGKFIAGMKRLNNFDFRANISNGGTMERYEPTLEEKLLAEKVSQILKLDFCGVDILQTNNGPVVCEVNSNAHLVNITNCSMISLPKVILEYVKSKL